MRHAIVTIAAVSLSVLFACSLLVYARFDVGTVITLDATIVAAPLVLLALFVKQQRRGAVVWWRDAPRLVSVLALATFATATTATMTWRLVHAELDASARAAHLLHAALAALEALVAAVIVVVYARWLFGCYPHSTGDAEAPSATATPQPAHGTLPPGTSISNAATTRSTFSFAVGR